MALDIYFIFGYLDPSGYNDDRIHQIRLNSGLPKELAWALSWVGGVRMAGAILGFMTYVGAC